MAAASLCDAVKFVGSVDRSCSKVCKSQSVTLIEVLDHFGYFLKKVQDLKLSIEEKAFVWDETVAVLQRARHLLYSCQHNNWLVRSLLFEERGKSFRMICAEIYSCLALIVAYLVEQASAASIKPSTYAVWILLNSLSSSCLKKLGEMDRAHLMALAEAQKWIKTGKSCRARVTLRAILLGEQPAINHKDLKLKGPLGHGVHGTVYEAEWLDHKVAVKVFPRGDTSFHKELRVLQAHKHPNVLHIAGACFDEKQQRYSLVMEKMDMDLANYLRKKHPLPLLLLVEVMLQIATGMEWLHSRNVIHRDLKPQNVLVCEKEGVLLNIRIADFGVSRPEFFTSATTELTAKQGSRGFIAPEVWNGERYSKKADVYSYGMLCYHLFTGSKPFKNGVDMEKTIHGMRPEISANCPDFLSNLMQNCWSQESKMRPSFSAICQTLRKVKARTITGIDSLDKLRSNVICTMPRLILESPPRQLLALFTDKNLDGTPGLFSGTEESEAQLLAYTM